MSIRLPFTANTVALFFALTALVTWQYEWHYSPINRVASYLSLTYAKNENSTLVLKQARILIAAESATPEQIVSKLSQYGINAQLTTVANTPVEVPFAKSSIDDPSYIQGFSYTFPKGLSGAAVSTTSELFINKKSAGTFTQVGDPTVAAVNETTYVGKSSKDNVLQKLNDMWKAVTTSIAKNDMTTVATYTSQDEKQPASTLAKITDLSYKVTAKATISLDTVPEEFETNIRVGSITVKQANCPLYGVIFIYYQKETKLYTLSNLVPALNTLCNKPKAQSTSLSMQLLSCTNCWLAPVSKSYSLRSTYAPVVVTTGLNGGGYVTPDTKTALVQLFADAKSKGITPRISSSYRSYQTQQALFSSYVKSEQSNNPKLTETQAIAIANTYSAKAGQSEHQLGTTLDIVGCPTTCNFNDPQNTPVYNYLKANAHKFGFIISYPNGSQNYTGYVFEPWHVRYIGVSRATELYNKNYLTKTGYYLYQYLLEKGNY